MNFLKALLDATKDSSVTHFKVQDDLIHMKYFSYEGF